MSMNNFEHPVYGPESDRKSIRVELTPEELACLREMARNKAEAIEAAIPPLEIALDEGTAPNRDNAEEELETLREKLGILQHGLLEKLSDEGRGDADNEVSI